MRSAFGRCSFRYCKRGIYNDHYHGSAGSSGVLDHWSDRQYFSDSYLDSGADTDVCTEDRRRVSDAYVIRRMDAGQNGRFYDKALE